MSGRYGTNHCLPAPAWMQRNNFQNNGTSSNQHVNIHFIFCGRTPSASTTGLSSSLIHVADVSHTSDFLLPLIVIVMDSVNMEKGLNSHSALEFHSSITYLLYVCNTHLMKVTKFLKEGKMKDCLSNREGNCNRTQERGQ